MYKDGLWRIQGKLVQGGAIHIVYWGGRCNWLFMNFLDSMQVRLLMKTCPWTFCLWWWKRIQWSFHCGATCQNSRNDLVADNNGKNPCFHEIDHNFRSVHGRPCQDPSIYRHLVSCKDHINVSLYQKYQLIGVGSFSHHKMHNFN